MFVYKHTEIMETIISSLLFKKNKTLRENNSRIFEILECEIFKVLFLYQLE